MRMTKASPLLMSFAVLCVGAIKAQTAPPVATSGTLAPGAGVEAVQHTCTVCHPPAMITSKRRTRQQWSDVVDQMINKGAQVSDEDYDVIVAYLARTYAPTS